MILATILATAAALGLGAFGLETFRQAAIVLAAALLLAATGAFDDLRPLGPLVKLVPQFVAVGAIICFATPAEARLFPALPLALERTLAILAGVWFVNLVNFMDGIDWITVAGCGVPLAALAALACMTMPPSEAAPLLTAALCGALIGFSPFNKPVARVFLGDVGSLPVGMILGYGTLSSGARRPSRRRAHPAALLPMGFGRDALSATLAPRTLLGGSPQPCLPARHGRRVERDRRGHAYLHPRRRSRGARLRQRLAGIPMPVSAMLLLIATALVAGSSARLTAGPAAVRGTSA